MKKKIGIFAILAVLVVAVGRGVWAQQTFVISGNGQGTSNSLNIQEQTRTTVLQQNNGSATNNIQSNPNTGNNSVSGSNGGATIKTGNATSTVNITNTLNLNNAIVTPCCGKATPKPSGQPSPTNVPGGGDGGSGVGGGGSSGGSGGGSSGGGSGSGGGGRGGGQILGLAATTGPEPEQYLFYGLGLVCLALGGVLVYGPRKIFA